MIPFILALHRWLCRPGQDLCLVQPAVDRAGSNQLRMRANRYDGMVIQHHDPSAICTVCILCVMKNVVRPFLNSCNAS